MIYNYEPGQIAKTIEKIGILQTVLEYDCDAVDQLETIIVAALTAASRASGPALGALSVEALKLIASIRQDAATYQAGSQTRKLLHAAADALARTTEASGWRDIATAPKDGHTEILVFDRHSGITSQAVWKSQHGYFAGGGWYDAPFTGDSRRLANPTHWQPLPSPPASPTKPRGDET